MANLTGNDRARYVQDMFTRIAPRYDLMNRIMTGGQDMQWRRSVIRRASLSPGGWLLDLGAGTGDLARQALLQQPQGYALAADFTLEMMRLGRSRQLPPSDRLFWSAADAVQLPFPDDTFDAVVSGFLLRNVTRLQSALSEQYRVLKPGGWLVALDTAPPPRSWLSTLIRFHLRCVIPTLGRLITGHPDAYRYLPQTTEGFLEPERLAARLLQVGFREVGFQRRMLGAIGICWGRKTPLN